MKRMTLSRRFALPYRQTGLSLVELMIAMTIGLFLLAGLASLIAWQSSTRNELEKSSRQIENGRYAIQLLADDLEHAGFFGPYAPPRTTIYTLPTDPCDTTVASLGWTAAFTSPSVPAPVSGYTGVATDPIPFGAASSPATTCSTLVENRKSGTPTLIVRRTATETVAAASAVSGTTYLQVSRCNSDLQPFVLNTTGFTLLEKDCVTVAPLRKYIIRTYYISNCNVCSGTNADTIPTLKMVEFIDGALTNHALVEGIENIRFDFGVDTQNVGSPSTYSANPAALTYDRAAINLPATGSNWGDAMTVRVSLLARNIETTVGYVDGKTYTLGSSTIAAANDNYKRHVYARLVRLVNPSARRGQ